MKILCDCGCKINQPINANINSVVSLVCINCKKKIVILTLDENGYNGRFKEANNER